MAARDRSKYAHFIKREFGKKYGKLLVVGREPIRRGGKILWECQCDCGRLSEVRGDALRRGEITACGCNKTGNPKHGHTQIGGRNKQSGEYRSWHKMKTRCCNPKQSGYENYGGRGITVCGRWLNSFENFLADMGPKPTPQHSIDRYPDTNGNYEPGNCRWATRAEQNNNKTSSHVVEFNGVARNVTEWSAITGVSRSAIYWRLANGWSVELALSKPSQRGCSCTLPDDQGGHG